jgi:hypothetical protein
VAQSKRQDQTRTEPKAWWQRAIAGDRLPKDLFEAKSKCHGTVEDHRNIALDVRELIRKRVFEQPVGSVFHLNIAFPWLRAMRLKSSSSLSIWSWSPAAQLSCHWFRPAAASRVNGCGSSARCVVGGFARSIISTAESRVGTVMAFSMRHSAPAATAEGAGQAEGPPQAWRLRSTLGGQVSAETTRHVAADLRT